MNNALLSLIAAECKEPCANEPDLLKRIKKAMVPVANGHWMVTDEDMCIRGALAAVLLDPETTEDDKQRITLTLEQMRSISAMISGVPVDIERVLDNPDGVETVPLVKLWHEAKAKEITP
jgi:hypothetical protein